MPQPHDSAGAEVPPSRLQASWVIAAFSVLAGVTLVYIPYEFTAPVFHLVYPWARPLGTAFMAGGILLGCAALYPTLPRPVDLLGRIVTLGALAAFWWYGNVLTGAVAGAVLLGLSMAALLVEAISGWGRRPFGVLGPLLTLGALGVGGAIVVAPERFAPDAYPHLGEGLPALGGLLAGGGLLLLLAALRRSAALRTLGLFAITGGFAALGYSQGSATPGAWRSSRGGWGRARSSRGGRAVSGG